MRWTWVWALAAATLVAGCGDASSKKAPAEPQGFEGFVVPEGTLAIRGVVVNEAIVPLEGATVTLPDGKSTTSNEHGAFAFIDVEAGTYLLTASKPGFTGASASVDVVGEDDRVVRIQLISDPTTAPWSQTVSVRGFLQCGIGLPAGSSYSACQTPNGASEIACDTSGDVVCLGQPMDHRGILEVAVPDGLPMFAQAEAVWDATNPSAQDLLWQSFARHPGTLEFNDAESAQGPSPLLMPWNQTRLQDNEIGVGQVFVFQVYPASSTTGGNVVLQQQVELFVTTFYHYAPPEGWSFAEHGPALPP